MKKNIFVVLAAAVMLLLSSCSKDIELPGTTWKTGRINKTITYQGISGTISMDFVLNFTSATKYELTYTGSISAYGMSQSMDGSSDGTYTFDGEKGVLTDNDGESQTFTYNKDDKTITAIAEMEEGFSFNLVFTQQK